MNKNVLWLIAARSGSKSVPDKNIKLLGEMPLLAYRIKTALCIAKEKDVWLSTDSEQYAAIGRNYGATIPFLRPAVLATDTAKSADVVLHAMQWAEQNGLQYSAIGLLEPTAPFVSSTQLAQAVDFLFADEMASSIVAVRQVRPSTFYVQEEERYLAAIARNIHSQGIMRRQEENVEITPSGGFYIAKWDRFKDLQTFYTPYTLSFRVPDLNGLEIDEALDWQWAEYLIIKRLIRLEDLFKVDAEK